MMLPQNLPTFTKTDLKTKSLTGLFINASVDFLIDGFHVTENSYVFLKESKVHNSNGPAIIMNPTSQESVLWYLKDNKFHISTTPFSALGFSYSISPSEIHVRIPPKWNGSQFTYDLSDVWAYRFLNTKGDRHCDQGPACVTSTKGAPAEYYFYLHEQYSPDFGELWLKKRDVLDIIKSS